jgi:hypothetical protein
MPNETEIIQYITDEFDNIHVVNGEGNSFFYYGPMVDDNKFPFATLVTKDDYDQVSNLNRPDVFRLNIGVSKASYLSLFGAPAPRPNANGIIESGYDYTALDQIMPHPIYGNMFWVSVLNPSPATFEKVQPLLAEAYDTAVRNQTKQKANK